MARARRNLVGALLAPVLVVGLAAGCSDDDGGSETTTTVSPQQGQTAASAAACETEYRTVLTAMEAYRAANDAEPTSTRLLVGEQLRQPPKLWRIVVVDGKATLEPSEAGEGCEVPEG